MKVLGIETATTICGVAVSDNGKILCESELDEPQVHAEMLVAEIARVMKGARVGVDELDGIAVSNGPGSFTGLRIGLSVAKGLVFATGKSLLAIPTLAALAWKVIDAGALNGMDYVLAALDARRDEVYCQLFRPQNEPVWGVNVLSITELLEVIGKRRVIITGDAGSKILGRTGQSAGGERVQLKMVTGVLARCSAGSIARMGEEELRRGHVADAATLEPLYVKDFYTRTR